MEQQVTELDNWLLFLILAIAAVFGTVYTAYKIITFFKECENFNAISKAESHLQVLNKTEKH